MDETTKTPRPIPKTCKNCGAERYLYHPCPECGQPTFKDESCSPAGTDEVENLVNNVTRYN